MLFNGRTDTAVICGHFTDEHGSNDCILVPHIRAGKISVALFESEDEAVHFTVCFQIGDLIADPLEAGQGLAHLNSVMLTHQIGKRCGHDGFACNGLLRHGPLFDAAGTDIIQKQNAHFVSADKFVGAVRAFHGYTHTIRIRIRGQHKIRPHFLGKLQTFFQCGKNFRIGIGTGGEIPVGIFLFGNDGNIRNTDIFQDLCHGNKTRAVQRRVHQLQTGGPGKSRPYLTGFDGLIECCLAVVADELNQPLFHTFGKGHDLGTGEDIRFLNDIIYHRGGIVRHLASIGTIGFVPVVLGRVMRCGDHDTSVALIIAGGKAQCRDRHQRIINTDFDSIGSQYAGGILGKIPALQPAVVGDRHRLGSALGLDPVRDSLRCLTHDPYVHAVGTCAESTAQACGTEFQRDGEAVLNGGLVSFNALKFCLQIEIFQFRIHPTLVFLHIHNFAVPFFVISTVVAYYYSCFQCNG